MVDRIRKLLNRLTEKESVALIQTIERIIRGNIDDLDVKRLQGSENAYRVRKGDFRIIFQKTGAKNIIIAVERRSDNTYNTL